MIWQKRNLILQKRNPDTKTEGGNFAASGFYYTFAPDLSNSNAH